MNLWVLYSFGQKEFSHGKIFEGIFLLKISRFRADESGHFAGRRVASKRFFSLKGE
jgi:hypothetical protein